jgi:IclR family mhp operon transcriptional activator
MSSREADDIQSLRIGVATLRLLNGVESISSSELAEQLQLSRASAYRVLKTLASEGYVVSADPRRAARYRLSLRVRGLSDGFDGDVRLMAAAQPLMLERTARDGWPLTLSTPAGDRIFVRFTTDHATTRVLKRYRAGYYAPCLYSAAGLVCLANQSQTMQQVVVNSQARSKPPPYGQARSISDTMRLLEQVRQRDYATYEPIGERENSIAVPLRHAGMLLASLTMRYMRVAAGGQQGLALKLGSLRELATQIELQMESPRSPPPAETVAPGRSAP